MSKLALMILLSISLGIMSLSCSDSESDTPSNFLTHSKATSLLLQQVALRQTQLASPTAERLSEMRFQGMDTVSVNTQRIYIYLKDPLTAAQRNELQVLGIIIYLNSWISPVGNNPEGFYLAEMPIDQLDRLAAKDYVIRLDTAEKQLRPQS
jgi:hypothetical protein